MIEHLFVIEWLHILGAAILCGTGLGLALGMGSSLRVSCIRRSSISSPS